MECHQMKCEVRFLMNTYVFSLAQGYAVLANLRFSSAPQKFYRFKEALYSTTAQNTFKRKMLQSCNIFHWSIWI